MLVCSRGRNIDWRLYLGILIELGLVPVLARGIHRLNEGLEAMDMLKFGRPGEVEEESEISKMWMSNYQQVLYC